ncbi:hypothetical protein H8K47_13315 [Undibacterium sp. CY7W]|uniref:Uncharacterized protein n=1 Tax=Undibacterium rugosum TaxID=2762291 RepID=A0A923IBP4_9BURK|nr:hypothetical protein [Undibacterium rugosum]MBC3936345.1 hypothetical protein [Undibacterium rugosum]
MENERALDVKYRAVSTMLPLSGPVPNFKVMKQLALQAQFGWFYPLLIAVAPIAVLLAAPWQWLLLLIGAAGSQRQALPEQACRVFATTDSNLTVIDAALDSDPRIATLPRYQIRFDPRAMGAEIGWSGCASAMRAHLRWLLYALTRPAGVRRDLLLHGRDALALLGLAHLARQAGHIFVTDDHYQRWAHVLSHAAADFRIVQHGFLDEELVLPHAGGCVSCLYLRDVLFHASFERYYGINEYRLFSSSASFAQTPLSGDALLLASSFPSIDEEIKLLDAIRESCGDIPIIVKFHPVHRYDARREKLAAYASLVYEGAGNPGCRIFVSHGSFMEFDYRRQGIATVSIARSGSVAVAVDEIRSFLAHPVSKEQNTR